MFLILKDKTDDNKFSYLLCKNPANTYDRDTVKGKYIDNFIYQITCNADSKKMLSTLKDRNEESYVSYQYEGVTPINLNNIFGACLRSALTMNYPDKDITDIASKPRDLECIIGPFICNKKQYINTLNSFNLSVSVQEEKSVATSFKINSNLDTLSSFLQKIFILSMYFTFKYNLFPVQMSQIEKYIAMSKSWFEKNEFSKYIIRIFSNNRKDIEKKMCDNLITDTEDNQEVKDQLYIDYMTLHQVRHNFITKTISELVDDKEFTTIVDYGCANGKLSLKLNDELKKLDKKFEIYSYDANDKAKEKLERVKHVHFYQMNLLVPNFNIIPINIDILILSEIIEHFDASDRQFILFKIVEVLNPKIIILTTPNGEYNKILGVPDGEMREKSHKIEFIQSQYKSEIRDYFVANNYEALDYIINENKEIEFTEDENLTGATFITGFNNKDWNRKLSSRSSDAYASYYLPISDYSIAPAEFANGYSAKSFMFNKNIFYMAPTVPPVEYDRVYSDYLEHPMSAFQYFQDRGINTIVGENKYMGSRAHVLLFKTIDIAHQHGFNKCISIITRNGNEFFFKDEEKHIEDEFYNSIELKYDVTVLDCEMMPWKLKASNLIDTKFLGVGEASVMNRQYCRDLSLANSLEFIKALNPYIQDSEPYCRIFGILALGTVNGRNTEWIMGTSIDNIRKQYMIGEICGTSTKFLPVEYSVIELNESDSIDKEVDYWKHYTENGGEGRVYKPVYPRNYTSNGYMIQPMLKVRGRPYLRIIYSQDYLEPSNFAIVCNRSIKKKRIQAIQETELSDIILKSFLNKRDGITRKLVAGFIGTENVNFGNVDKTL